MYGTKLNIVQINVDEKDRPDQMAKMNTHKTNFYNLCFVVIIIFSLTSCAQADMKDVFEKYLWQQRILVVLAPERDNALLSDQINFFEHHKSALKERDIIRWVIVNHDLVVVDGKHTPQIGTPPFYKHFNADPNDFTIILIGKDGEEKMRKNTTIGAEELFEIIDSMPMRQREINQQNQ